MIESVARPAVSVSHPNGFLFSNGEGGLGMDASSPHLQTLRRLLP
jgi:hypothetical protein